MPASRWLRNHDQLVDSLRSFSQFRPYGLVICPVMAYQRVVLIPAAEAEAKNSEDHQRFE